MPTINSSERSQLLEMMASGADLRQLELWLEVRGQRFRSRKSLGKFLLKIWRSSHSARIAEVQSERLPALASLPTYEVIREGVIFRICGVAHGQRLFLRMKPEVRQQLRSLVIASSEGARADYVTERGFARILDLPREKELDYARAMFERVGLGAFLWQLLRMALILPILPLSMALLALSRDPIARESRKCLLDLRHLARAQQVWRLTNLPAKLRIALSQDDFRVIHSAEMAKASIARVLSEGLNELNIFVGLAHQDEIAYFLTELEFSPLH